MRLKPETTLTRDCLSLDGIWRCSVAGSEHQAAVIDAPIAIPGSWNEQLSELGLMNYTGTVMLSRQVSIPVHASEKQALLHFGSADYHARVFWNGVEVGQSGPPKLPFVIDLSAHCRPGQTGQLEVHVTAQLPEHGPMQAVTRDDYITEGRPKDEYWPAVRFDFFPFGGLNRSVTLNLIPKEAIDAPIIRTAWDETGAHLSVEAQSPVRMSLEGPGLSKREVTSGPIPNALPWSPDHPNLYTLTLEKLGPLGECIDLITRKIGFRTCKVEGERLLLNGEAVTLRGFGKHEDSPIAGRGINLPYLIKDFQLLKWIGANSVRTSHYPYDETFLDLADEMGILVISEVFSVNLDFRRTDGRDLDAHKNSIETLFARDGHNASVIAWSLSNEPGYLGEGEYRTHSAPYWQDLFAHARKLDDRPMTVANVQYAGIDDPAFEESDFLSINRYFGWYTEPGQLSRARDRLHDTFETLTQRHGKPIFVAEFGADAVAGLHATTDQMWTEDYQSDFIETYWEEITAHPACIGGHVWNFADFRTAQHGRRAVMNRKGVFTRERDPKRAAFTLKRLWKQGA